MKIADWLKAYGDRKTTAAEAASELCEIEDNPRIKRLAEDADIAVGELRAALFKLGFREFDPFQ